MDFMTAVRTLLELIETAAMLGALVYITRGIRMKDNPPARKAFYIKGGIFAVIFVALNLVGGYLA